MASYKELITRLQKAPEIPPVVPLAPYPTEQGVYKGSSYYITATTLKTLNDFLTNYLGFLATCKEIIYEGRQNSQVISLANEIIKGQKTNYDKAKVIHSWVYKNVNYQTTPNLIPPWKLIQPDVNGDCKSFAVLIASLLGIADIPCWLKLVEIPSFSALHIYNFVSLKWEVIDGTGAYVFKEVKPVSGYVLFEIDKTLSFPPEAMPQGGVISPETLEALSYVSKIAIGAGIISAAMLGIWTIME